MGRALLPFLSYEPTSVPLGVGNLVQLSEPHNLKKGREGEGKKKEVKGKKTAAKTACSCM